MQTIFRHHNSTANALLHMWNSLEETVELCIFFVSPKIVTVSSN